MNEEALADDTSVSLGYKHTSRLGCRRSVAPTELAIFFLTSFFDICSPFRSSSIAISSPAHIRPVYLLVELSTYATSGNCLEDLPSTARAVPPSPHTCTSRCWSCGSLLSTNRRLLLRIHIALTIISCEIPTMDLPLIDKIMAPGRTPARKAQPSGETRATSARCAPTDRMAMPISVPGARSMSTTK